MFQLNGKMNYMNSVLLIAFGVVSATSLVVGARLNDNQDKRSFRFNRHAVAHDSFGKPFVTNTVGRNVQYMSEMNAPKMRDNEHFVNDYNPAGQNEPLVRRRRLADDKKLDLKMKMQRVKKVVSLDAIGSYSLYRSKDRKTSLKAFGSTELWYDGQNFGLKKPGLGVQFIIYY